MINMKSKFIKIFFLDLSYFLLSLIILILAREKIKEILIKIQSYAPELNLVDPNQIEAQNLISQISSLANTAYLFIFIIIPIIIFLLYILLQGYSFYILKKEKNYFLKFTLASLPTFVFLILLMFKYNLYLLIITILSSYLSFFLYFMDLNKIKLAFAKIYKYFPLYLIFAILSLSIISLFFMSYLIILTKTNYFLFLFGIIFISLFSYYKIILAEKLFN